MTPVAKVLFKCGTYGHRVSVIQREHGSLVLRYTKRGKITDTALKHSDERRAKRQAKALSLELAKTRASNSGAPGARDDLTVGELFARYTRAVSVHKKGTQPSEDARRRTLWLAVLGPDRLAMHVTPSDVREFIAKRSKGAIVVDGLKLAKVVKPRTVDADVVWIQSVFNWAYNEARLVRENPLRGSKRPDVAEQLRPMAPRGRVDALLAVAPNVHARFPLLLTCVRYLGWRISAVCGIDGADVKRTASPDAPHGMIRKSWQLDKEGTGGWIPMPKPVRDALDALATIGAGPLFPSPGDKDKPWSRYYARDLLERAETLAGLDPLDGGDWHPYRRLWATERKTLPTADVADAAGWRDRRTVEKYQQRDPDTLRRVMLFDATAAETKATTKATASKKRPRRGNLSA